MTPERPPRSGDAPERPPRTSDTSERPPRTSDTTEHCPRPGDTPDRVRVGVAELAVARDATLLTSSGLGSCVAVAVADPTAAVAGLAHVMVPSTDADATKPAKAVPDGVRRLLTAVETAGADPEQVEAKLAGGSRMLDFSSVGDGVGRRNVEAARESLAERDVPVVGEDVGGSHGRSVKLHPRAWTLAVTSAHEGEVEL